MHAAHTASADFSQLMGEHVLIHREEIWSAWRDLIRVLGLQPLTTLEKKLPHHMQGCNSATFPVLYACGCGGRPPMKWWNVAEYGEWQTYWKTGRGSIDGESSISRRVTIRDLRERSRRGTEAPTQTLRALKFRDWVMQTRALKRTSTFTGKRYLFLI